MKGEVMLSDEQESSKDVEVYQFIHYAMLRITYNLKNFDRKIKVRRAFEIIPVDGDLCDAPSMRKWLEGCIVRETDCFGLSAGGSEPLRVGNQDLSLALEALAVEQRDMMIQVFQNEMSMADYAAMKGISTRMAYIRAGKILDMLYWGMTGKRRRDESGNGKAEKQKGKDTRESHKYHKRRHHRSPKRKL